jgi:dTDP-4-amino-4,6-dideoxygalactose transaminase
MTALSPIPFVDLAAQQRELKAEILACWEEILDGGAFVGGTAVSRFEDAFARACGVDHCVAVSSGTDALRFILLGLGLAAGDEVITVPNTFFATAEAIVQAGGRPVFVDVDPRTWTLDPRRLAGAVTPRTRGIVPVHLYGQPAEMAPILSFARDHGLWVVEDACQAHLAEYNGRRAGGLARAGAFSFYPAKNLGACGEAGAVTTNDPHLAEAVRMLRDHGQSERYRHRLFGYNGRCDALQAAVLSVKLPHLARWNAQRRRIAAGYLERLGPAAGVVCQHTPEWCRPVHHLFVVLVEERDRVASCLQRRGIQTGMHYPVPIHLQEAFGGGTGGRFPVAESCAERLLSLPIYPGLTEAAVERVCGALAEAIDRKEV